MWPGVNRRGETAAANNRSENDRHSVIEVIVSEITIVSGDFCCGSAQYSNHAFALRPGCHNRTVIARVTDLASLECVNKERSADTASLLLCAGLGLVMLGPLGFGLGLWLCATQEDTTFRATFKDGRCFIGIADERVYQQICKDCPQDILSASPLYVDAAVCRT